MASMTPIVVLEDNAAIALTVRSVLVKVQTVFGLEGRGHVHTVPSAPQLQIWLDGQPDSCVRLLLLDFFVYGGDMRSILPRLRDRAQGVAHRSLAPDVLILGWSGDPTTRNHFRDLGADGFISKNLSIRSLSDNILAVIEQRQAGAAWVEILEESGTAGRSPL